MTELLERARAGDERAFGDLVAPYHRELQLHCYRMLGSLHDAQDAVQETLLSAWQGVASFEGRASLRTWLYRIATNRCLDILRVSRRQPTVTSAPAGLYPPAANHPADPPWLQPYPDVLLGGLAEPTPGPEARAEAREGVSLAFIRAIQLLPPRQRAVLILRDVLGFGAREVAGILTATEESVTSALKRARAAVSRPAEPTDRQPPPHSPAERRLVEQLTRAFEAGDVPGVVALLTDDVVLTMPPLPLAYQGRDLAGQFLAATALRAGSTAHLRATRANGQPAFGLYVFDPHTTEAYTVGLMVLTLAADRISALTRFDADLLTHFALPVTLSR